MNRLRKSCSGNLLTILGKRWNILCVQPRYIKSNEPKGLDYLSSAWKGISWTRLSYLSTANWNRSLKLWIILSYFLHLCIQPPWIYGSPKLYIIIHQRYGISCRMSFYFSITYKLFRCPQPPYKSSIKL